MPTSFSLTFLINILYTILFASIWFLIVSNSDTLPPLGGKTFDIVKEAAGFVDPRYGRANVHVVTNSQPDPLKVNMQVNGEREFGRSRKCWIHFQFPVNHLFLALKTYFIIIVFSYARSLVVRSHLSTATFSLNPVFGRKHSGGCYQERTGEKMMKIIKRVPDDSNIKIDRLFGAWRVLWGIVSNYYFYKATCLYSSPLNKSTSTNAMPVFPHQCGYLLVSNIPIHADAVERGEIRRRNKYFLSTY